MAARWPRDSRAQQSVESIASSDSEIAVYKLHPKALWNGMRREPLCFWLLCGYVFFEYVRPQGIYPVINVIPWTKIFLLAALVTVIFDRDERKSLSGPLTVPYLGYFAVVFLSFIFAFNPAQSMDQADVLVNWVIVYLLFLWMVNSKFRLWIVFLILLLASFKMAQFGFRSALARGFAFQRWGVAGPSGWFANAGDLGVQMNIYIAWAVAFVLGMLHQWKHWAARAALWFMPVAGLGTVLATGQRNAILGVGAMGLAFIVFSRNRARNLLIIGMVAAIGFMVAPQEFKDRFVGMQDSGTAQTRMDFWERGMGFYAKYPVLGVGYNNYTAYYAFNYPGDTGHRGRVMVAHSVPVTVAAETGTLGLIFFYLVVLTVFITNVRLARLLGGTDPPFFRYLAQSLNYGLIGFLVTGIFLSVAYYPFLWFQASLTAALYSVARSESAVSAGERAPITKPQSGSMSLGRGRRVAIRDSSAAVPGDGLK